jgi:hypothetical protein
MMPREAEGAVEGSSLIWRRFSQEELDDTRDTSEGREVKPVKWVDGDLQEMQVLFHNLVLLL